MMKRVIIALSLSLLACTAPAQEKGRDIKIGEAFSLRSKILNEERPYWVYLPASYDDRTFMPRRYPVLYLLDGEAYFHSASGVVQFMSSGFNGNNQIPELIVVAIPNTDRTRDLTPTHSVIGYDGKEDPSQESSGGGAAFLQFLRDELFPKIESAYRTLPYRILAGHSDGGLLAAQALLDAPEMFNSYVALDPSLWWDNQVLIHRAEGRLKAARKRRAAVYLSLSNNPDIGFGDPKIMVGAVRRFDKLLKSASPGISSTLQYFEAEDHVSVPLVGLYHGLLFIFEGYKLPFKDVVERPSVMSAHFKRVSERIGVTLLPPEPMVNGIGNFMLYGLKDVDKAIELFRLNVSNYPDSYNAYKSLGNAYRVKGENTFAIENYEKALKLNPDDEGGAKQLQELKGQKRHK
jgi:predicted alpha/beta superfamily hydrolase